MSDFSYSVSINLSLPRNAAANPQGVRLQRRLGLRDACAAKGRMGGLTPEA